MPTNIDPAATDITIGDFYQALLENGFTPTPAKVASPVLYDSFSVTLGAGFPPTLLLGYDLSRTRVLIRAQADGVSVGKHDQLSGGTGYLLSSVAGEEFHTTDNLYARYVPADGAATSVTVSVFVEKTAN